MEKEKKVYRLTKASYVVRVLVGAYLLYTVYELVNNWQECTGMTLVFSVLGAIVFLLLGIFFVIQGIFMIQTGRYAGGVMDAGIEAEEKAGDKNIHS
ncbi:MAG: hypothetical protein ACI4D2_01345 [Lachnospiraceae bacterium]